MIRNTLARSYIIASGQLSKEDSASTPDEIAERSDYWSEAHAVGFRDGYAAGVAAERERCRSIINGFTKLSRTWKTVLCAAIDNSKWHAISTDGDLHLDALNLEEPS